MNLHCIFPEIILNVILIMCFFFFFLKKRKKVRLSLSDFFLFNLVLIYISLIINLRRISYINNRIQPKIKKLRRTYVSPLLINLNMKTIKQNAQLYVEEVADNFNLLSSTCSIILIYLPISMWRLINEVVLWSNFFLFLRTSIFHSNWLINIH